LYILISMIRIWFFWTPELARQVLSDLLDTPSIEVVFVVTNPDKPVWRSATLTPTPVKELALTHAIPVFTPTKIRDNAEFLDMLRVFACDYFVVVAYGKILPKALLDISKKKCINIHGSILPKYRGASPIQSALLEGETETGVTIMEMSEGMDEWDILKIHSFPLDPDETAGTLFDKFGDISWKVLIQTLQELEHGGITPLPQDHSRATYCKKIEKEHGRIDWSSSAKEIYQKWQAYTPWPGVFTEFEGKRLLLEKVLFYSPDEKLEESENGTVVKLDSGRIGIICGQWILTLEQVKLEWKKSQSIRDFVNGNPLVGYRL
jgi:methionyl-tRNA formyltransferase